MDRHDFSRLMRLATSQPFDREAWEEAFSYARRRNMRKELMELIRIEIDRTGFRWDVPQTFYSVWYRDVKLCWDQYIAGLFVADVAEHVLYLYEDVYPDDDRPRRAIEAARMYARGQVSREDLRTAEYAAKDAVWRDPAVSWAARRAAEAAEEAAATWSEIAPLRTSGAAASAASAAANDEKNRAMVAERVWQQERLAQYLLGEVTPCWEVE